MKNFVAMNKGLQELVHYARTNSSYYKELYANVPDILSQELGNLPLVDHTRYWIDSAARVITTTQVDGIIIRTGGTTSKPKFTRYTQMELVRTATLLGIGLGAAGLQTGDRVGNLFYAGEIYGSFLLHILSLIAAPIAAIQIPIGGLTDPQSIEDLIDTFEINVLLSTITTLVKLMHHCASRKRVFPGVERIMFSGEPLFKDQQLALERIFPNASFRSCIYGSIDAGVVALSSTSDPRVHMVADGVVVEICSDEEPPTVITENERVGRLVTTNLLRRIMPVIRYPTGDRAQWVDRAAGYFRLLGRDNIAIRLGPVSLDFNDLKSAIQGALNELPVLAIQAVISRSDGKDLLECYIDANPPDHTEALLMVKENINATRPMLKQHIEEGYIADLRVKFVSITEMQVSETTGKLLHVVDRRNTS